MNDEQSENKNTLYNMTETELINNGVPLENINIKSIFEELLSPDVESPSESLVIVFKEEVFKCLLKMFNNCEKEVWYKSIYKEFLLLR